MYYVTALGYECFEPHATLDEARKTMAEFVKDDISRSPYKLCKVKHSRDCIELKIGSRQSVHTYSQYSIVKA